MKVFLSWSGDRSEKAASIFYWWLSDVIQSLDPWMSSEDIESGTGWSHQIRMALQESNFGLIFVTRSNMNRPWLLFEAGALAKHVADSRAVPLIVDDELELDMLPGPFSQLQARKFSKDSVLKLLTEMNALVPKPLVNLKRLFETHWPILEQEIAKLPKEDGELPKVTSDDKLDTILNLLRAQKPVVNSSQELVARLRGTKNRRRELLVQQLELNDAPISVVSDALRFFDEKFPNIDHPLFIDDPEGKLKYLVDTSGELMVWDPKR